MSTNVSNDSASVSNDPVSAAYGYTLLGSDSGGVSSIINSFANIAQGLLGMGGMGGGGLGGLISEALPFALLL